MAEHRRGPQVMDLPPPFLLDLPDTVCEEATKIPIQILASVPFIFARSTREFRTTRHTGTGGSAHVFEIESPFPDQGMPVVLKMMNDQANDITRSGFIREALALEFIRKNITSVHNIAISCSLIAIVVDQPTNKIDTLEALSSHVTGLILEKLDGEIGAFEGMITIPDLVTGLMTCLHYLHDIGLRHMDIKSHNVLFRDRPAPDGGKPITQIVLCDFAMCTAADSPDIYGSTPEYAAPERVLASACCFKTDERAREILMQNLNKLRFDPHARLQELLNRLGEHWGIGARDVTVRAESDVFSAGVVIVSYIRYCIDRETMGRSAVFPVMFTPVSRTDYRNHGRRNAEERRALFGSTLSQGNETPITWTSALSQIMMLVVINGAPQHCEREDYDKLPWLDNFQRVVKILLEGAHTKDAMTLFRWGDTSFAADKHRIMNFRQLQEFWETMMRSEEPRSTSSRRFQNFREPNKPGQYDALIRAMLDICRSTMQINPRHRRSPLEIARAYADNRSVARMYR